MTGSFVVDPRIAADSVALLEWELCQVRLMDDARYPWLLLLPRRPGLIEWTELDAADLGRLAEEIRRAGEGLRSVASFEKLNVAAIGNIVRQMHVHIVGRSTGDAAWPGPVWGHGARQPYDASERAALADRLRGVLSL